MRDEIRRMFPELAEIRDAALREKVVDVWEDAIRMGGWKPEELMQIPFTLLADDVKIMYLEHVRTVCRMCIAMEKVLIEAYGSRTKIDHDVLVAGALLADVGKMLEYEKRDGKIVKGKAGEFLRHPFSGVGLCCAASGAASTIAAARIDDRNDIAPDCCGELRVSRVFRRRWCIYRRARRLCQSRPRRVRGRPRPRPW